MPRPALLLAARALDAARAAVPLARARRSGSRCSRAASTRRCSLPGAARELVRGARDGVGRGRSRRSRAASASDPKGRSPSSSACGTRATSACRRDLRGRLERAARVLPGGRVGTFRVGGGVVYGELETSLGLQQAKAYTDDASSRRVGAAGGARHRPAGDPARPRSAARGRPAPRRGARAAAGAARARVRARALARARDPVRLRRLHDRAARWRSSTRLRSSSPSRSYATNLVELIGLGLAIDYSLLIVCRYREELGAGRRASGDRADDGERGPGGRLLRGSRLRSAWRSSSSCPFRSSATLGLAGLLIPLVSIAAALTLQPALLSFCGRRAFAGVRCRARPTAARALGRARARDHAPPARRARCRRRPLLLAAAAPALFLQLTPGSLASLPRRRRRRGGLPRCATRSAPAR